MQYERDRVCACTRVCVTVARNSASCPPSVSHYNWSFMSSVISFNLFKSNSAKMTSSQWSSRKENKYEQKFFLCLPHVKRDAVLHAHTQPQSQDDISVAVHLGGSNYPRKFSGLHLWWVPTEMTINPHHKWAMRATWQGDILLSLKSQNPWGDNTLLGLEGLNGEGGLREVWENSLQGRTGRADGQWGGCLVPHQPRCHSFWDQNPE